MNTNQIKQVKFSDDIHKKYFISNGSNSNEHTPLLNLAPKASSLKVTSNLKPGYASINNSEDIETDDQLDVTLDSHENLKDAVYHNSINYSEHLTQDNSEYLSNKYESLDYDMIYNLIELNEKGNENSSFAYRKNIARWIVMLLVGFCTGLVAVAIDFMVDKISTAKYSLIAQKITKCTTTRCLWQALLLWISTNAGLAFLAASLVVFLAPAARGSGIPMVKCYLNGIKMPEVVRVKTLIAKVFGVAFAVAGGLACGKEGPMIHSGSIVAAGISQGLSTSLRFDLKIFKYFRNDHEKRDFVSGGAAAGVAAAFGAPIGGVLFSLEEGASFWNQALTWRIFFCSMVSTFTLNIFLSALNGRFGDLSNPGLINFGKFSNAEYTWYELIIFILMGCFGGLIGGLFNHVNIELTKFRNSYVRNKLSTLSECVLVACISAVVGFLLSFYFSSDCQPIGRDLVSKFPVQLFCDDGQYNAMSGLFFQTPEKSVRSLFHDPPGSFNPVTLTVFCIAYYILAVWTYGLAIPSGLFIPSLLIGAAWGRLVGIGMSSLFPDAGLDPGKYALIGAAATLGGLLRMTLSLTAIITEATGDITLGLPIMFAIMSAKIVGDIFNEGLFDMHIQLSGTPLLDWEPPAKTKKLSAHQIMTSPVVVFKEREKVGNIIDALHNTEHHGFPVVDMNETIATDEDQQNFGLLKGLILRHQLLTLLKKKMFFTSSYYLTAADFRESYPRYINLNDIDITPDEREMELDLRPYMNLSPYSLTVNANLPRIFRLFRGLGLRHLVIVDENNRVAGIVTRIDIAKYRSHVGFLRTIVKELSIKTN